MHKTIEPSILYFGTPVVLISTRNEDGTTNVSPISSIWFLGWSCMIGMGSGSKTTINLLRERECVINLPSVTEVEAVNKLAKTTGSDPVPPAKLARDYRYVKDKLRLSGLSTVASDFIQAQRISECPFQLEAVLQAKHTYGDHEAQREYDPDLEGSRVSAFELKIVRVHAKEELLLSGKLNHIDPDKWKPLIMSFARFYGLADGQILPSALAEIPEELYRPAEHMG